jgi:hypothetical protein
MDLFIDSTKTLYPIAYKAIRDLIVYDTRVENKIKEKYGKDTIHHIIELNEYNKTIDNELLGKVSNNRYTKYAVERKPFFDNYILEIMNLKKKIEPSMVNIMIEKVKEHIQKKYGL